MQFLTPLLVLLRGGGHTLSRVQIFILCVLAAGFIAFMIVTYILSSTEHRFLSLFLIAVLAALLLTILSQSFLIIAIGLGYGILFGAFLSLGIGLIKK